VHFVQEPFDQASIVRPYTKWEYNLPSGVVAKEALRRAHTMMMSDPKGPVYLTFPRETLTELWSEGQIRSYPEERFGPASAGADVGLLVDVDVPWIPRDMPDNPATWWAHVDLDAEKRSFPMWTFPANLRLQGDSHRFFVDLLAVLKARADAGFKARAAERVKG